jgi:hypothetical protein
MTVPAYIADAAKRCAEGLPEDYRTAAYKHLCELWHGFPRVEILYELDQKKHPGLKLSCVWNRREVAGIRQPPRVYWLARATVVVHTSASSALEELQPEPPMPADYD